MMPLAEKRKDMISNDTQLLVLGPMNGITAPFS
jgi:hypothetical protein